MMIRTEPAILHLIKLPSAAGGAQNLPKRSQNAFSFMSSTINIYWIRNNRPLGLPVSGSSRSINNVISVFLSRWTSVTVQPTRDEEEKASKQGEITQFNCCLLDAKR
jgi:hypothetical protein